MKDLSYYGKSIAHNILATGELALRSFQNSIITGIDYALTEPEDFNNAHFGELSDVANNSGKGWVVNGTDRLTSAESGFKNMVIYGSTGSGKSVGVAIPNLLALNGESVVVHDASGQLCPLVKPYLEEQNYEVHELDWTDGDYSIGVNIFDFLKSNQDINKVAHRIHSTTQGSNAPDKFWLLSSVRLTAFCMSLLNKQQPQYRNMANVLHMIRALAANPRSLDQIVVKYASQEEFAEYKALIKSNEKTLSSILLSCQAGLELWSNQTICRLSSKTTIDIAAFRARPCALFIRNAVFDSAYYNPLNSIVLDNIIGTFMGKLPSKSDRPVWFILDETSTLDLNLDLILSNNRKFKLAFQLYFQNKSQAFYKGKEQGNNLLANCWSQLYLPGCDMATANELQSLLGNTSYTDKNGRKHSEPLMSAQAIRQMKSNEALLICGNHRPFKVHMTRFYDNPFLKRKANAKPLQKIGNNIPANVPLIPLA